MTLFFQVSWIKWLPCCPLSNIYASLSSLQPRRNQPDRNLNRNHEHIAGRNVSALSPHVTLDMAGYSNEYHQRDNYNAIDDHMGSTEKRYEHLHGSSSDGHIYTGHIPRVMRDILAEMPPGMTAEDILRTCVDDQLTEKESDDEDPDEDSDYMEGQI